MTSKVKYVLLNRPNGRWQWEARAGNNRTIAVSSKQFLLKLNARRNIYKRFGHDVSIVEKP